MHLVGLYTFCEEDFYCMELGRYMKNMLSAMNIRYTTVILTSHAEVKLSCYLNNHASEGPNASEIPLFYTVS